jgi:pimeloyl-ACP methyl ester carboxylesterase
MHTSKNDDSSANNRTKEESAIEYAHTAEDLGRSRRHSGKDGDETGAPAIKAKFITPLDPVVETADGGRLPVIPVEEAVKLNELHDQATTSKGDTPQANGEDARKGRRRGSTLGQSQQPDATLRDAMPPSRTNPLFPPLPTYGPPSPLRSIQCFFFRITSGVLSLVFLLTIFLGAVIATIPQVIRNTRKRAMLQNPRKSRPFFQEEMERRKERKAAEKEWVRKHHEKGRSTPSGEKGAEVPQDGDYVATEGGPDPLVVDVAYYARRVGLDMEIFEVQTEDGFIIELWHVFNPREYKRPSSPARGMHGPDVFQDSPRQPETEAFPSTEKKYPVLMVHGLLQSSGAFCSNDDDSLAFYLAKSGYDVWLGNNRCGFHPKHTMLDQRDPRMWAWNIRQMGILDLPALISRVLAETGFPKLALIAHSQGTTETFVALAKEQRPDIGEKISVFCALAPAAYAGPLIGKIYFKVMRLVSPAFFRIIFGIHGFIPFMMFAHTVMPAKPYSWMGYHVFSHLFNWSDKRWDRGLRNRMFQWAPVYVSSESMRWWLGRECFAKHKCILATREEGRLEDKEDEEDDEIVRKLTRDREPHVNPRTKLQRNLTSFHCATESHIHHDKTRGRFAWYNQQFPPLALWIAGADDLVDGRRLLRRFDRGREPYVKVVHKKIIEGYEHLDVIWAMDMVEKVGKEVREVIWRTVDQESALMCRVPVGCGKPLEEEVDINDDVPMMHSGGRLRMASISEVQTLSSMNSENAPAAIDESEETPHEHDYIEEEEVKYDRRLSEAHFVDIQEKENPLG